MRHTTIIAFLVLFLLPNICQASPYLIKSQTWQSNLTDVTYPSLALGDVDNDGDMDLAISGCSYIYSGWECSTAISKIFINNGTTLIESYAWQQNLTQMHRGSLTWGDINNDGNIDLIIAGCSDRGGYSIECTTKNFKIYLNNGNTLIENHTWQHNMNNTDLYSGSISLGDVDNDGDLDLVLIGADQSEDNGIYINNGTTFLKNSTWISNIAYMGQMMGSASTTWGDLNNDGYLDLIVKGSASTNFYSYIYINNGTKLVRNSSWEQNIGTTLGFPSIALGDYRNNGKMDMVYIGANAGDHIEFFNNTGNTLILSQENLGGNDLVGILDGGVSWGDYDNDGDLDLASNGRETFTDIYTNRDGIFDRNRTLGNSLTDLRFSSIVWVDIDNDNDLDLIQSGDNAGTFYTQVYINNASLVKSNNIPISPNSEFNSTFNFSEGKLSLSWSNGSDTETPTLGLYYNLRVGTCSGCHDVVSGVFGGYSNPTAGYFGNMMQRKSIILNRPDLENQTIYWSVQTIDTGLAKSAWSTEQVYLIGEAPCTEAWSYSDWSACVGGTQTKTAIDLNSCGTTDNRSALSQSCTVPSGPSGPGSSTPPPPADPENDTNDNVTEEEPPIQICQEGGKRCSDTTLEVCSGNGTVWDLIEDCQFECQNQSCMEIVCEAGQLRCNENVVEQCNMVKWIPVETCEFGCENGKCVTYPYYVEICVGVLVVAGILLLLVFRRRKRLVEKV